MPELSEVIKKWSEISDCIDSDLSRDTNTALWQVLSQIKQLMNLILMQSQMLSCALKQKNSLPEIIKIEQEQDDVTDDKHITTNIYWSDGDTTSVKNIEDDEFNILYAINLGIAIKFMGSKNKLRHIYKTFARDAYEREYKY